MRVIGSLAVGGDTEAPSIPTGVIATALNKNEISASWDASTDNVGVTGYHVFANGVPQPDVASGTSTTITGLTPSTLYNITVAAFDAAGNNSGESAAASATTPANAVPVWGSIAAQDVITSEAYALDLAAYVTDSDVEDTHTYSVLSGTLPSGLALNGSIISGTPTTAGQSPTVTFRVSDGNDVADKAVVFASWTADVTAPPVPTGLAANAVSSSQINLSWTASTDAQGGANEYVSGTQDYRIYRDGALRTTVSTTSYNDTGLSASTSYSYAVSARDVELNESAQSSAVQETTQAASTVEWTGKTAHYVRAGAAGSGNGSDWTNAYTTLPASLTRDHVYYIADGSYGSYTFDDATSTTQKIYVVKATAADHGTDTGWDSAYGDGEAVFSSWSFSTDDWVVDGQVGGGPTAWNTGHGFRIFSTSTPLVTLTGTVDNITLRHAKLDSDRGATTDPGGTTGSGFGGGIKGVTGAVSNLTVSYCAITEVYGPCFHMSAWTNCTIEYSYMYANRSTGAWHSEGVSSIGTNTNIVLRWNLWDSIEGTGVLAGVNFGASVSWKFYGNIIARSVAPPVAYYWEVGGTNQNDLINSYFLNNTMVGKTAPGGQGAFYVEQGSGNVGYNNLWYNNDANAFFQSVTHDYSFASDNIRTEDAPPGSPFDKDSEVLDGEANGQDSTGSPFVSYNANPLLANFEATTNAGFDTGALVPGNDVDMFGVTRTSWTRGAIE